MVVNVNAQKKRKSEGENKPQRTQRLSGEIVLTAETQRRGGILDEDEDEENSDCGFAKAECEKRKAEIKLSELSVSAVKNILPQRRRDAEGILMWIRKI